MDSDYIGCQVSFPDDLLPECPSFKHETVQCDQVDDVVDTENNNKGTRKGNRRKLQQPRRIKNKNNTSKDAEMCDGNEGTAVKCSECDSESEKGCSDEETQLKRVNRNKNKSEGSAKIPCEVCGRLFAKRYMSTHMRSHKEETNADDELRRSRRNSQKWSVDVGSSETDTEEDRESSDDVYETTAKPSKRRVKTDKYCCYVCDRSFTKQEMAAHMRTHTDMDKKYVCYICDGQFTKQQMVAHQLTHCKKKPKKRKVSEQRSGVKTDENLLESLQVDEEGEEEEEEAEEEEEEDREGIEEAKKTSKKRRKRFPCEVCGGLYLKSYLPQHRRCHTGEKPFSCDVCNRSFSSAISLRVHKKHYHSTDHGKIQCNVCGRLMSSKMSLEQHLLTHSNEKPFQCEVCGKAFKQSSVLSNHLKTHNDGLPYQCEACGRRYKSVQGLILHRKAHHEGVRNLFPCELCEKSFTRRTKLKDHIMWHKGLSPYKCQYCAKRLVSRKTLNTHLLIHEDKKPYDCKVCGKAFRQNCVLKRHMSVHTGIKPFSCQHCSKQFIHRVYLAKHTCEVQDGSRTFLAL